ncbi:zinc-ribbon domain-containing protein [Olleya sp. Bg11-27]|uniref:zinc-ribbon domain-containing protein n=1 Tax=Olleya sp. Bg11-27 TaxID=2058135 RepID=UPI000C303E2B|nr:zinc-ribbon domain-containing protein [Olleya sp. Bg11-27]AUC75093.1 hypothetical protein CW732_05155 [Olleya sp. Bg11-27]
MEAPEIITPVLVCKHCDMTIQEDDAFCEECGYPIKGSEQDVAKFYAKRVMDKRKNNNAEEKIKSARNTLYVIAGVVFLFGLFLFFKNGDNVALLVNFILGAIYMLLGTWSKQKPLVALLLGLLLYITIIVISAIADPLSLVAGVIWKVLIIAYLGKGIYSASSINKAA